MIYRGATALKNEWLKMLNKASLVYDTDENYWNKIEVSEDTMMLNHEFVGLQFLLSMAQSMSNGSWMVPKTVWVSMMCILQCIGYRLHRDTIDT